jgi:two-component system sensor histidine kinase RegB
MFQYPLGDAGNAINLRRLIWLRFIIIAGEFGAIAYAIIGLHISLALIPLVVLLTAFILISLLTLVRLQRPRPVSNKELFIHLTIDVLALTFFLYLTGGSTNPFAPLYLVPLTLTAASLPGLFTWIMVAITITCYSVLLFFYVPLAEIHGSLDHGFRLHVLGMWVGFLLSAVLIAIFVVSMARTVRRQEKKITDLREQQMRHEQIVALGTLAAGAAHELGTPLATMSILLNDAEPDARMDEKTLSILRKQVGRCRGILGSISASAGSTRAESGSEVRLDKHLTQLIQSWQESRSDVVAQVIIEGTQPAPHIVADQTLDQSLLSILNNAADASPQQVEINATWNDNVLTLEVADRGAGMAPEVINKTGEAIYSTKQDGMGLGLFLSSSTLERLGGTVHLYNREGGGVLCQVKLPLNTIMIPENHD